MTRRNSPKTILIGSGLVPIDSAEYQADYQARLKAAGLDDDGVELGTELDMELDMQLHMDDWRMRLGRKIDMCLNRWPGCPEPICQRMRGCMAPSGGCANAPPPCSEEEMAAEWPKVKLELRRALDKVLTERGVDRG